MVQLLSRVHFFVTPGTVARQVPLSMGFSQARILEWVAISFFKRCHITWKILLIYLETHSSILIIHQIKKHSLIQLRDQFAFIKV